MNTLEATGRQRKLALDCEIDHVFYNDVINGLSATRKNLAPKYFYDTRGSRYFDAICRLPEYYPYRVELRLLHQVAAELNQLLERPLNIIEFGAGSLEKIQPLLSTMECIDSYVPIDISAESLKQACQTLIEKFPGLEILPIAADFTTEVEIPPSDAADFGFFPGSTIGNYTPSDAVDFLRAARQSLGADAYLLIGVDTKKSARLLHRAYNDREGITARFNLNILHRINRELNGDINLHKFEHYAFYNPHRGRIEMHLVSTDEQVCTIGDETIHFNQGESIHTENSYKYTPEEFTALAGNAGWRISREWMADKNLFSVFLLSTGSQASD
ncbi:MAG: L-histidine N(alpha)-methyltransferase [Gammaproteobacteria bacterium]|nr:L-histidine N(alpha)-methyltransferase [Pseudomonadales bacterium]MCP5348626.1 L-histidine N(alpha)-methyltransferase [Pseudomonadales bacterium]